MKIEPINIIHTLVIWQSLLFAVILFTPKYNKKRENKFLALLLLTLGIHFSYNILLTNQLFLDILPKYSCSYGFLYGPFLFLYVKFHFREDLNFKPLYFLHFVPFVAIVFLTAIGLRVCNSSMFLVLLSVMFIYGLLAFAEITHYKKVILQISSNSNNSETKWVKTILFLQIAILILNFLHLQLNEIAFFNIRFTLEPLVQLGILVFVNVIIYQGLKNPQFFQKISETDLVIAEINQSKEKTNKLNIEELNVLAIELEEYMSQYKPYLNSVLDLDALSKGMEVHPKKLSQAINQILKNNFSEYINSYRIEEAKLLLRNNTDSHMTIMEIMYDVGFNSRSVFNTAFKNKTGLTPSQYRANK
jgi:AraC-like DNA-binding protein